MKIFLVLIFFFELSYGNNKCTHLAGKFFSLEQLEDFKKSNSNPYLFWHQTIPTTGLWHTEISYPYIPHWYSLWELAPKKGKDVSIVLFDTGVAGYDICNYPQYKKHPNLEISEQFNDDNLNYSNTAGFDSFIHFVHQSLQPLIKNSELSLEKEVIKWIQEYCFNKSTKSMLNFFRKELPAQSQEKIIYEITQGRRGIMPRGKSRFFTPITLRCKNDKAILEFLPLVAATPHDDKRKSLFALHGTHIFGLINAKLPLSKSIIQLKDVKGTIGLAPESHCIMIKICDEFGNSDKETLMRALKKAQDYNPDIINLSLKLELSLSEKSVKELENALMAFPYVVAASGNEFQLEEISHEAYPARCAAVTFDVGSFSFDGYGSYPISQFSQYEKNVGPKFVAPGFNIMSTGFLGNECGYLFLNGTSMAAALISGFVALVLSEFKHDFTRDQILKVCYASTFRMHKTDDWQDKCTLGVLDMRTVLFILHVCREFKKKLIQHKYHFDFEKRFNNIIRVLLNILYEMPRTFAKKYNIGHDFVTSFADFIKDTFQIKTTPKFKKWPLETTLVTFVNVLFALIDNKKTIAQNFLAPYVTEKLFLKLQHIL